MSRLIVKGLPIRFDDKQLRELFSFAGEVTDAKVIKTRDGKSRQFGFVGFRTTQEAKSARHRLNKSYVDTSKVSVDFARAVGDASIPRPWSKYSAGSSLHEKNSQENEETLRRQFLAKEADRNKRIRALKERERHKVSFSDKDKAALEVFQETLGKRASQPLWADGGVGISTKSVMVASRKTGAEGRMLERKHVMFASNDGEDDTLYEDLPLQSAEGEYQKDSLLAENGGPRNSSEGTDSAVHEKGDHIALNDGISDLAYFKSKVVQEQDGIEKPGILGNLREDDSDTNEDVRSTKCDDQKPDSKENKSEQTEQLLASCDNQKFLEDPEQLNVQGNVKDHEEVDASETGRLLVRNLAFFVTSEDLEVAFESFGTLADVHIVKDAKSGKSRGIGFVQFVIPEHAPKALVEMDGTFHSGRIIHVLPAKPRPVSELRPSVNRRSLNPGNSSYKANKEEAQKVSARQGLDGKAQHTLHMSSDAVAEVMVQKHGASKADLYGTSRGESGIAAVRLAMAEATIQNQARQFLLDKGVDLEIAEEARAEAKVNTVAAKRKRQSRTAFLVKNLPAETTGTELDAVFARFGSLNRLVVVPSGLLAVVEYSASSDAKRAYNTLAYTRFRDTPLYLEWLPVEALTKTKEGPRGPLRSASIVDNQPLEVPSQQVDGKGEKTEDLEHRAGSVYVKNLNFDTRDSVLKSHFVKLFRNRPDIAASFRSAKVALKRNPKTDTKERLSMGFGFLEFSSMEHAREAMKLAQNTVLDGHTLQLRLSNRIEDGQKYNNQRKRQLRNAVKAGPKLIVRNVAFEATKRDIRQLFSAFGELKLVRIPKKPDGSHRGFAFIEFVSKDEARSAFKALSAAHLYGRRLVIEYADEDADGFGSVSALQEKAAAYIAKKRIRANDGTAFEISSNGKSGADADEQAVLEDALYS